MGAPAAPLAIARIRSAVPSVLADDVGAHAGTTVAWTLNGEHAQEFVVGVADDGTATEVDRASVSGQPTVGITTDTETFTLLGAGRRAAAAHRAVRRPRARRATAG